MKTSTTPKRFWTGVPPWIFIGAVAVLFPIFAFMTVQNINRQKENSLRLLLEKGAALIRSFEAGTRTGIGMQWRGFQLQKLLTETAQQPDILYIMVTDMNGTIMVHNNPAYIGKTHAKELSLQQASSLETVQGRHLGKPGGKKIFEVYRRFAPDGGPMGRRHGHMMMELWMEQSGKGRISITPAQFIIFVGLDTGSIDEAIRSDTKNAIVVGISLLLIGFSGIMLLFLAQSYRTTQTSLSRIKAFSDNVVENMPIGLVALDHDRKITSLNNAAESVLNLSSQNLLGRDVHQVLPVELLELLDDLDTAKGAVEKEVQCDLGDKKVIPLEVGSTVLQDESGTFLGYLLLFKDLSEVRALRDEVARSQRLASLGMLAAGVSHEIRNPLSSIKGFATYFKERYHDKPEDQHISKLMIQEVDRLNRVVGQLHEFSRPVSISKKGINLEMFIEDSLKLVERQATASNITLRVHLAPEVGDVCIDPDRIKQVLLNLYLNAIESMDSGGSLSVAVSSRPDEKGVEIRVSDTGTGIGREDLAHIFDPYFTTKASGTGLGLAIVHNIVEAHGGEIGVESNVGTGTSFTVLLPGACPEGKGFSA